MEGASIISDNPLPNEELPNHENQQKNTKKDVDNIGDQTPDNDNDNDNNKKISEYDPEHSALAAAGVKRKREEDDDDNNDVSEEEDQKIEMKLAPFQRFWTHENEIVILKRLHGFYKKQKIKPYAINMAEFYLDVKKHIALKFSKLQLSEKVRKLRGRWKNKMKKNVDVSSLEEHDRKVFKLSEKIWGGKGKQVAPLQHGSDGYNEDYNDICLDYLADMAQQSERGLFKFILERLKLPCLKAKYERLMVAHLEYNAICLDLVKDIVNLTLYKIPSSLDFLQQMVDHSKLVTIRFLFERFKLLEPDLKKKFVNRFVLAHFEYVGKLQELGKDLI